MDAVICITETNCPVGAVIYIKETNCPVGVVIYLFMCDDRNSVRRMGADLFEYTTQCRMWYCHLACGVTGMSIRSDIWGQLIPSIGLGRKTTHVASPVAVQSL